MNLGMATDESNPNFAGAKDPDSGLFVEFYWHEPVDAWASRLKSGEEQRNVVVKLPKQPFVRIMVPGDKNSEWTQAVSEAHKHRFPRQWMAWQIAEGLFAGDGDIPGWKLAEWPELSEDMVRELTYLRFQTVDQLAGASDKQLQGIGMGGPGLREKARAALRDRMGAETRAALDAERAEKEELKSRAAAAEERLAKMEAAMEKMMGATPPAADPPTQAPEPVEPSRPKITLSKPEKASA